MTQRAHKYRIYPNCQQRKQLAIEFGHARFVWNRALDLRSQAWAHDKTRHNYVSLCRLVTLWKTTDAPFLAEATRDCLTQALIDQDKAFKNFFEKRGKYPRKKRREGRQSVRYILDQRRIASIYQAGKLLVLPKLGKVKVRWSDIPTGTPKMATVSKDPCGWYSVSFSCDEVIPLLPATGKSVGVDVGVKDVVVTSAEYKSGAPRHYHKMQRRLKMAQRRLSRKRKGSGRWHRQRQIVAKIHARIANKRAHFLHDETTRLVSQNDVIALEDLNVAGMLQNHKLAKSIADCGLHELRRQVIYKASWYGKEVIVIDRFAPTSKLCSVCGYLNGKLTLDDREWTCPDCGTHHDRDVNAVRNILVLATGERSGSRRVEGDTKLEGSGASLNLKAPSETRIAESRVA